MPLVSETTFETPLGALLARAELTPEAAAFIADGQVWNCHRVVSESARLAEALHGRGVQPGDRVAVHMFNRVEVVLAYLACWRIGAVAVPLNTRYKTPELVAMLTRIRPAIYLGETELYGGVCDVASDVVPSGVRFVVGLSGSRDGAQPWTALAATARERLPHPEAWCTIERSSPAMLLATSGTTGPSKLAIWTHETLAAFTACSDSRGLGGGDTFVAVTPMMHASGAYVVAACLLTGAVGVIVAKFDPDAVLDAVAAHRCTAFFVLPFMAGQLARCQRVRPRDVSSLRICFAGGDTCSAETEQAFAAAVDRPLPSMWAATEDTSCGLLAEQPGPLTRMMPGTGIRLVDAAGAEVDDGETGEMLVRSSGTAPGYWLGPDQIDLLPGGWFHTGDLMHREADGQLRYMGRMKDLIVRGGSNISPSEVEEALRRQPDVADAAVAGLPDPELGQRVGASLVLIEGVTEAAVPSILAGVRCELADYKVPEKIVIVAEIPRNALTKVDRHGVTDLLAGAS